MEIIVALARNGAIGKKGDLLFHISADLRHFKEVTLGNTVVMGRKTFESLPGGPLPGRRNIVVSRTPGLVIEGAETASSLEQALEMAASGPGTTFVIGGAQIYAQALPLAERLHLTLVDADDADADTFFPAIDPEEWVTEECGERMTDPRSGLQYAFTTLRRK